MEDLVDYIFSLTGMTDLRRIPREKVRRVLENNMSNGILYVPKEYGMFIAKKINHPYEPFASEKRLYW